jgi:hypothetical protein
LSWQRREKAHDYYSFYEGSDTAMPFTDGLSPIHSCFEVFIETLLE